jgi:hypothetical protein
MKVFIPPLGTKMVLNQDWHFNLPDHYQNEPLIKLLKAAPPGRIRAPEHTNPTWPAMLPAGTELIIRTIDVRQAQNGWEKIAFSVKIGKNPSTRFFVRGADANKIDATIDGVQEEAPNNAAVAAIIYALSDEGDGDVEQFLSYWVEGDFDALRRNWNNIPDEVFIGADPLFKPAK